MSVLQEPVSIPGPSTLHGRPPRISVIIPLPPEMAEPAALAALRRVNYPGDRYEVILAWGRNPSRQRNMAARAATGEILLFLDDDSQAHADLLLENASYYSDPKTACVGGPNVAPEGRGAVEGAINSVLSSLFGDFRGCKRFARRGGVRATDEDGLILCNASVRAEVFRTLGGFPEELYPNEENAFFSRVLSASKGYRLLYVPGAWVTRRRPPTIGAFVRKVFGYGVGRLNQTFVKPSPVCALRLLAVAFPAYLVALALLRSLWALSPALLYLAGDIAMAARILATAKSPSAAALSLVLFPAMHVAYGCGILWGLARKAFGRSRLRQGAVTVRTVKAFEAESGEQQHAGPAASRHPQGAKGAPGSTRGGVAAAALAAGGG